MPKRPAFVPEGVIPACLLPMTSELEIDEANYRRHIRHTAQVRGVTAITVNGHASEVTSCTADEQARILDVTMEEVGDRVSVINGIAAEGGLEAARLATMSKRGGADALLVFPPSIFTLGAQARPEMVIDYYRRVADASSLPLIIFQFPEMGGLGYSFDTLLRLIDEIPTIVAMKDYSNDPVVHERNVRELQNRERPFSVLTTHSAWLFSSLVNGSKGLLSGAGSVIADLQVSLFEAVRDNDLATAKRIAARMYPISRAFYNRPLVDMHNRMKEAAVLLGRLPNAAVRPPLQKLSAQEIEAIRQALQQGGIGPDGAEPDHPAGPAR